MNESKLHALIDAASALLLIVLGLFLFVRALVPDHAGRRLADEVTS